MTGSGNGQGDSLLGSAQGQAGRQRYNSIGPDGAQPPKGRAGRVASGLLLKKPLSSIRSHTRLADAAIDLPASSPNSLAEAGSGKEGTATAGEHSLHKTLTLWDLIVIAVAGTLGSGVFGLVGLITNRYAGPAAVFSWVIAGIGCTLSGLSFTELSSTINSEGGCYAYVYVAMGEVFAVVAAYCLTLEFGVSSAAVAKNWGDKVVVWLQTVEDDPDNYEGWQGAASGGIAAAADYPHTPKLLAAALQLLAMFIMLRGIQAGKRVMSFFTVLKMLVILIMCGAGILLFRPGHLQPFAPEGTGGVLRGAGAAFFGLLGFDEVCILSAEAKNPLRDIPLALLLSLAVITCVHCIASLAIVGVMPYDEIDPNSPFLIGFIDRGLPSLGYLVAVGELLALPIVTLVCFLAQPRIFHAMACDGLLPRLFAEADLKWNTLVCGVGCTLIALFAPFDQLDSVISAAVLVAFNLTNSSLIILRRGSRSNTNGRTTNGSSNNSSSSEDEPATFSSSCLAMVLLINVLTPVGAALFSLSPTASAPPPFSSSSSLPAALATSSWSLWLGWAVWLSVVVLTGLIALRKEIRYHEAGASGVAAFEVPLVPWVPALAISVNGVLLSQLPLSSLLYSVVALGSVLAMYLCYGKSNSVAQQRAARREGREHAHTVTITGVSPY